MNFILYLSHLAPCGWGKMRQQKLFLDVTLFVKNYIKQQIFALEMLLGHQITH